MKRLLRSALSEFFYRTIRFSGGGSEGLRILTYHRITDAHPGDRLCVSPKAFAAQMRWLHESGYRTLTFAQAVDYVRGKWDVSIFPNPAGRKIETSPETACRLVITFDDGFEDNYRYAYPTLKRLGFSGCFFVPSAFIAQGADTHPPADRPMSRDQLLELLGEGHEVGAHSISHAKLTHLTLEAMRLEVSGSKEALERSLQSRVAFFCYPSGDYNEAVRQAVQESGYDGACTVEPGANRPGGDPFALKRTEVSAADSLRDFEKKLSGAYDWLHRAVQWSSR